MGVLTLICSDKEGRSHWITLIVVRDISPALYPPNFSRSCITQPILLTTSERMPTQSVTKSSHYVSVQQSSTTGGGTSTRYLSWTVGGRSHYFCSLPGILRILEIILLLVVLIIARAGKDGHQQPFGRVDASFLGIGSTVGLLIIFLMFTLCTLLGHIIPNLLEVLATLVGAILMITTGALAITYYHNLYPRDNVGMTLGSLAIITGIILAVDFALSVRKLRISVH